MLQSCQVCFVQDFPSAPPPIATDRTLHAVPAAFARLFSRRIPIIAGLKHLTEFHPLAHDLPLTAENGFQAYHKWDWSKVRFKMVMSMAGTWREHEEMQHHGITSLAAALRESQWVPGRGEALTAEYQVGRLDVVNSIYGLTAVMLQSSSISSYSIGWMTNFYRCLNGIDSQTLLRLPQVKKAPKVASTWPPIKVVFPTLATVDGSLYGRRVGLVKFLHRQSKLIRYILSSQGRRYNVLRRTSIHARYPQSLLRRKVQASSDSDAHQGKLSEVNSA